MRLAFWCACSTALMIGTAFVTGCGDDGGVSPSTGGAGGGPSGSTTSSSEPSCPPSAPQHLSPCLRTGQACTYEVGACGQPAPVTFTCTTLGWTSGEETCCPLGLPTPGDECSQWSTSSACTRTIRCDAGDIEVVSACDTSSDPPVWRRVSDLLGCPTCWDNPNPEMCKAAPGCSWLKPGCGEGQPIDEGCYPPEENCHEIPCPDGYTCRDLDADPCWDGSCGTCSEGYSVCWWNDKV